MSEQDQKSGNMQKQHLEYLGMMSKDDVVALLNGISESFTKDYEWDLSVDRSEGNWPSESMVGGRSEAYDRLKTPANRLAILNRLGLDKDTPDNYRLVVHDDGLNKVLMFGVIEGSEFVATHRLDLKKKYGDFVIDALFGLKPDNESFVKLSREEQIKIPIMNTTYEQKARYEHGIEVINLTIEEQKALQADVTLKTPIRENDRDPDIRIGVPKASKPGYDRKPDQPIGAPNNPKLSKPSIPEDKTFQASVEQPGSTLHGSVRKESNALLLAGISGPIETTGPNGTSQVTKIDPNLRSSGKQV